MSANKLISNFTNMILIYWKTETKSDVWLTNGIINLKKLVLKTQLIINSLPVCDVNLIHQKSSNEFFRLIFWMDGPLSLCFSLLSIILNIIFIMLMCSNPRKTQKTNFHYLIINFFFWNIFNLIFYLVTLINKYCLHFFNLISNHLNINN